MNQLTVRGFDDDLITEHVEDSPTGKLMETIIEERGRVLQ